MHKIAGSDLGSYLITHICLGIVRIGEERRNIESRGPKRRGFRVKKIAEGLE